MSSSDDGDFKSSALTYIIFRELIFLTANITSKAEKIFSETTTSSPVGGWMKVDHEVHALISSLISDAACLKKLISTPKERKRNESASAYRFRMKRRAYFETALKGIDVSEIVNSKVRNSLEHFDEYLDKANAFLTIDNGENYKFALYNIICSGWGVFNFDESFRGEKYPIRIYVAPERRFYNFDYSIDIDKIYSEAKHIQSIMLASEGMSGADQPVGYIQPLEPLPSGNK